ncbi:MAG: adenylate/guanylate cyclase domain-containing protein [Gallionellaceae bacterium]|nr:adenylate/guanylate cyclase domain-containing protein [Gallionellaceae bacterium]
MQNANKAKLITQLLELFESQQKTDTRVATSVLLQQIGRAIDTALTDNQGTRSQGVTILLSDLRGFTAVSAKHPALEMVAALNRYLGRMCEIIIRHGGTIDKFMGDAIMVLFGAPIVRDDDIESALACAIDMQIAMKDINQENKAYGMEPLYMGIGINTGEVVAGNLGSDLHSEYTVIGDQVNLVSRVEAHSLRGQILLSENTYQKARDYIEVGNVHEVMVKGREGVVRMYELLSTRRPRVLSAPHCEIRNSPRVEVDMPVMFQILEGKSVLPQMHHGRIAGISYGGMHMVSHEPIEAFSNIKIALSMSLMDPELTEIYAKVLSVSIVNDAYDCRVEFTYLDPKAHQIINEFVDGIIEMNGLGLV